MEGLDSITNSINMNLSKLWEIVDRGTWHAVRRVTQSQRQLSDSTTIDKVICAILAKIAVTFFPEVEKTILKFLWNHKSFQIVDVILKSSEAGSITLSNFKLYHKTTVIRHYSFIIKYNGKVIFICMCYYVGQREELTFYEHWSLRPKKTAQKHAEFGGKSA